MGNPESPLVQKKKRRKRISAILVTVLGVFLLFGKSAIAIPLGIELKRLFPGIALTHLQLDLAITGAILVLVILPIIIFRHNGNPWKFILHNVQKLKDLWKSG